MKYPDALVAKIIGAARANLSYKLIAQTSGVSYWAVRAMTRGDRKTVVAPDESLTPLLRAWFKDEQIST